MQSYAPTFCALICVLFCAHALAASDAAGRPEDYAAGASRRQPETAAEDREQPETTTYQEGAEEDDDDDTLSMLVFYTSHCEECGQFFATQLQPLYCRIKDYVFLELIAIASFNESDGYLCENNMKECRGNTIQNCVLSRINSPVKQLKYATCATSDPDAPRYINHLCLDKFNITKDEIEECAISQEGKELMFRAEMITRQTVSGKMHLPTIVFDNNYYDYDEWTALTDLEVLICQKLEAHGYGDICDRGVIINPKRCKGTRDSKDTKSLRHPKFPHIQPDF